MRVAAVARSGIGATESFIRAQVRLLGADGSLLHDAENAKPEIVDVATIAVNVGPWGERGRLGRSTFRLPALLRFPGRSYGRALRAYKPDIVHAHFGPAGAMVVNGGWKGPLVVSVYGYDVGRLGLRAGWRRAYQRLSSQGRFVAEGPAMAQTLASLGVPIEQIDIIPLSLLPDLTEHSPRPPRATDGPVRLGMVCRLVEKKGADLALRALALLDNREDVRLTLAGTGPLENDLRGLAAELGVQVRMPGSLDRNGYLRFLDEQDVLLFPSRTASDGDTEGGSPTTLIEAQLAGRVVVCSRHADLPAETAPQYSRWLFPENDVAAFARVIEDCISARSHWPNLANGARAAVLARHDDNALRTSWQETYARAIESGR